MLKICSTQAYGFKMHIIVRKNERWWNRLCCADKVDYMFFTGRIRDQIVGASTHSTLAPGSGGLALLPLAQGSVPS